MAMALFVTALLVRESLSVFIWYCWGEVACGWDRGVGESVTESLAASKIYGILWSVFGIGGGLVWVYFLCFREVL